MIKLAANLSTMFGDIDLAARFEAAAKHGFKGVEFLFPYDFTATQVRQWLDDSGLQPIMFDVPAGNWEAGESGIACLPGRISEFHDGVKKALDYANTLDCKLLTVLAGSVPNQPQDHDKDRFGHTLIDNLRYAATEAQKTGVTVLLEAINSKMDVPHYWVTTTAQARAIIQEVQMPNLKLQYDVFHMQIMEGNLANTIKDNLEFIGHIQIADVPNRSEPGTGEINFDFLLEHVDDLGYNGWFGLEYKPTKDDTGLDWADKWLGKSAR